MVTCAFAYRISSISSPVAAARNAWKRNDYLVAMYDHRGTLPSDLSFVRGDCIKVTLRTETRFDYWEGELRGKRGIFPANFCCDLDT